MLILCLCAFSYWWTEEPNDFRGIEDCVLTGYTPASERLVTDILNTWNDFPCPADAYWICEKLIKSL